MANAFPAKYVSLCKTCGEQIQVGSLIRWSRKHKGNVWHDTCKSPFDDETGEQKQAIPETPQQHQETPGYAPPTPAVTPTPAADNAFNAFAGMITSLAHSAIDTRLQEKLDSFLTPEQLTQQIETAVSKIAVRTLKIETTEGRKIDIDNAHEKVPLLAYLVSKRRHAYLYGDPGSGKSYGAAQVAKSLELEYAYMALNPQTPESRLIGYLDAVGNYHSTLFRKLYEHGGVFCFDELDNSAPSLLTMLNGCLENGKASFPDGMVDRHSNFVVVATGNTNGKGANPQFPDRRPFDAAFAERFTFIHWEYDETLEQAITLAINPKANAWLNWVRKVRAYIKANSIRLVCSPRASFLGAEYLKDGVMSSQEIADAVLFKGIDSDTKNRIISTVGSIPR